jgi:Tfp pilus assembly protein PilV
MQARRGFSLVEVVVALTILMVVMLALITLTGRTMHIATVADREQAALQLVTDRTDQILSDPRYTALDSLYETTETSFPSLTGLSRTTLITHVNDSINDYKKITVTVTGTGLTSAIARTVTLAAP